MAGIRVNNRITIFVVILSIMVIGASFVEFEAIGKKSYPCKIYIAKRPIPLKIFQKHDGRVLLKWFRANSTREVWEKEGFGGWDFWVLFYFSRPLNALGCEVSFYDAEVFPRHLVDSFTLMLMKKGERIIPHRIKIKKGKFKVNHRYSMVISVKKYKKGEIMFNLRGQEPVRSGEVVFTDEEVAPKKNKNDQQEKK